MKIKITERQYKLINESFSDDGIIDTLKQKVKGAIDYFKGPDTGCSKKIQATTWPKAYSELVKTGQIDDGDPLLIIWGPYQTFFYTPNGKSSTLSGYVSTGLNGFGSEPDSNKTPLGLFDVDGIIEAKDYEVLVGKSPSGEILGPNKGSKRVDDDGKHHTAEVLTSIIEIEGLEDCNSNTFDRNIYIHGTNKEKKLGQRASGGCIRMSNSNIKKLRSMVGSGTKVFIYGK